nr:GntR family transcriptional regulator [Corynebacterium heidelbergense]
MTVFMDEGGPPLFRQVAAIVADAILEGTLGEGGRAYSTNELAEAHRINPATARKGLNLLVQQGVLEKRRGLGMFVCSGARGRVRELRRAELEAAYVGPLIREGRKLGLTRAEVEAILRRAWPRT